MITERVTGLESFAICPLKWKSVPFDGSNIDTFIAVNVGDIVHIAHQYPDEAKVLADMFFDELIPHITGYKNNIAKKQLHNLIKLAEERIEEHKNNKKYFEIKNTMEISGVIVTGSYDCLEILEDKESPGGVLYHLIDFKTTSNIAYYSNWVEKKQVQFYAYMIMKKYKLDKIKVSYQVYVKGKDNTKVSKATLSKIFYMKKYGKLNQIEYIDNIEEKVLSMAEYYRLSREMDYYPPKPYNEDGSQTSHCRFCPLRDAETAAQIGQPMCPAKADNSSIDREDEIEF